MANVFKNKSLILTTTSTSAYVVPAATTSVLLNVHIANTSSTNSRDITVTWYDTSTASTTSLATAMTIPNNESLALLGGKAILETGDYISALASATSDCHMTLAIMEMS